MKIVTAPDTYFAEYGEVSVFLAGGICDCPDWQSRVIQKLQSFDGLDNLVVYNPRRENFPIGDPSAANDQIKWEFYWLQLMSIFSMFFCASKSDQPICMYELGRNLLTMHLRFPENWKDRCVITSHELYRRRQDVEIQTGLCVCDDSFKVTVSDDYDYLIDLHAANIVKAYKSVF